MKILPRYLLLWFAQIFLFVLIPVLLFYGGFSHIEKLRSTALVKIVEQSLENEMQSFEAQVDTERFLSRLFRETYHANRVASAALAFGELHARLNGSFDYLLWDDSDSFIGGSIQPDALSGDWSLALNSLKKPFKKSDREVVADENEMTNLRRMFGPQIVLHTVDNCVSERGEKLLWCDSTGRRPLLWVGFRLGYMAVILVKPENAAGTAGLEYYLKYRQSEKSIFRPGFVKGQNWVAAQSLPDNPENLQKLIRHEMMPGERLETDRAFYYARVIEDDLTLFAFVEKAAGVVPEQAKASLAALLVFMLLLPWVVVSGRAALKGSGLKMSISRKLALLFVYANGLPLLMLFFAGYDFMHQKELALYDEIHQQGTHFLQNLDERFESEHALQIVNIQAGLDKFRADVRQQGLNLENYRALVDKVYSVVESRGNVRFYLIASETDIFGTGDSLYVGDKRQALVSEIIDSADLRRGDEKKVLNSLGRFIMASLNGRPPDPRSSTEVELIAESAMQKPLIEVQHDFIANNGKIDVWGMGTNKSPACLNLISINDDRQVDYMGIVNWNPHVMENLYLKRQFLSANRNIIDLKVGVIHEVAGIFLPEKFPDRETMVKRVRSFTSKPCPSREFVSIGTQTYLLMGFTGRYLTNYQLFGLYPVDKVKSQISREKTGLFFAGLVSLLITIILGQFLAQSFLFPLQKLYAGAEAIRSRNFALRLPFLGRDEFGEMAEIFNTTMVDLEELQVAGVIQEHLLPRQMPECGRFRVFGRIVSMGELGGDYFDYFNTSAGRFSLLIGDVAGRGAGAALIMAMAKAAIMQFSDVVEKPQILAMRLHELIQAAGRRTRKTMIMQYLNLNGADGTGVYTNAGGWPPLIVNPRSGAVREITLPGPMLGALNRPKFGAAEISLQPGEAVIFYSDGVIEARNMAGEILGLARLKQMAVHCFDAEPQKYFDRLLEAHREFVGATRAQDDMTLLIAVFDDQQHTVDAKPAQADVVTEAV
jgi:hypothetical protein